MTAIVGWLFFFTCILSATTYNNTLVGNKDGLFILSELSEMHIWKEAPVDKIVCANGWYFLTENGILYSKDLSSFEYRNKGLPTNIIKHFDGKKSSFTTKTELLKDLEVNPSNPDILVTLTRDQVFITYDGGLNWQSLGFSARSDGAKAVAVCNIPNLNGSTDLTVFMSHSIYGLSYKQPKKNTEWHDIIKGLDNMQSISYPDEVSDILTTATGDVYLAQTFLPRLYKINWNSNSATMISKGDEPEDTWDSLALLNNNILFMTPAGLRLYDEKSKAITTTLNKNLVDGFTRVKGMNKIPHCAWFPPSITHDTSGLSLSELWMTRPQEIESNYADKIAQHHSIFVPPTQVTDQAGIDAYKEIIKKNKLDSIVINMKDDYGLLRYTSNDPSILEKGYVSSYAVDLNTFIPAFKKDGIYLIARIVVFKDRNLWQYNNGKYAVKDSSTGKPWQGLKGYKDIELNPPQKLTEQAEIEKTLAIKKTQTQQALAGAGFTQDKKEDDAKIIDPKPVTKNVPDLYDEQWVDPYSQDVWVYNVAIAKELIARGFDEIQFDYIRFPTDGINLSKAQFTWRENGMDKEDALISFLSYARDNIDAPIGIDIYGANGWYRTGARTGQDVEILSSYVDVICPMFYPSHFEQSFLAYEPAIERPYRIYYYGTYRNSVIARNKALIRPWVQAFYLHCSYDKLYYDDNGDYVRREMFGVRDATSNGFMFWNNSGRYTDITPVPTADEKYPWKSFEAAPQYRKPAL
jgi:hypothetical protein